MNSISKTIKCVVLSLFLFSGYSQALFGQEESVDLVKVTNTRAVKDSSDSKEFVELSGEAVSSLEEKTSTHVLAKPWFRNMDISGFSEVRFQDSGDDGTQPNAGFVVKHASLFLEAEAWEDFSVFLEFSVASSVRVNEVYVHFRNVLKKWGDDILGIKVGRIDIPFGEEYLWNDSPSNLLISHTAAYPWLWDEGIALYGTLGGFGWITSLTDGTLARSSEDDPGKAVTAKVYGSPWTPLYLSASFMRNGKTSKGALLLGGSFFQPVGTQDASSLGASPSDKVDAALYQIDAKYSFREKAALEFALGKAFINDAVDSFDRDLTWFSVQPHYNLTRNLYAILRYSEIGTYDTNEGYHLGGEFLAGGNKAFGYDAKRLQRFSVGLGWRPNPRAMVKLEIGRDRFKVIDASLFDPGDDDRVFYASEIVLSF
ncbi:MAG: hypothetical protein O7C75_18735 [Verrucomicrobia bacterium]|nr:hypothetical protein [Verrucomicrobiota bacterium]